jgi:hypothetical protein
VPPGAPGHVERAPLLQALLPLAGMTSHS